MTDRLIDHAYEWACKYGLGTEARTAIKAVLDEKSAEVERLERVRLQNENLIQHQSLKMDQFAAKVERLEERLDARPTEADITQLATKCDREWQAGMEAAAKVVREHPYCTNQETLAKAIDAAAKEQTGKAGSRELGAPASPSPGSASPVDSPEQT